MDRDRGDGGVSIVIINIMVRLGGVGRLGDEDDIRGSCFGLILIIMKIICRVMLELRGMKVDFRKGGVDGFFWGRSCIWFECVKFS